MRRFIALLMLGLFLSGCATVGHLKTPSGRPEVFIEGATLESATRSCANSLSSNGWEIEKVSDWTVHLLVKKLMKGHRVGLNQFRIAYNIGDKLPRIYL